jgi:protein TonB
MVEGLVVLTFVVQKNGSITDVKQVSSPLGFGLDEEAQRVVQIMPKWSPGRQKGKRIAVMFTLPIRFKLN